MPVNLITTGALLFLLFVVAMQSGAKDSRGRGLWARASADEMTAQDRQFFKLVGGSLAVAFVAFILFG